MFRLYAHAINYFRANSDLFLELTLYLKANQMLVHCLKYVYLQKEEIRA
jgi:hypothetical protein